MRNRATVRFYVGLSLGQAQEFTALAVLGQSLAPDPAAPDRQLTAYAVRHLERFPPGTPYAEVGARLVRLFAETSVAGGTLVVDQTGVGRPVVELLRRAGAKAPLRPVTVTAGHKACPDEAGGWLVPKKDLVGTLQILLQGRRLKVASTLPEAATLLRELQEFQVKVTLPTEEASPAAWREGPHDDLVLAVAVAAWEAERCRPRDPGAPYVLCFGLPPRRGW